MRAKNNKKAVLRVLTKTFFSSMRKKNRVDKQIHVVRNASRGVLRLIRLSPGLIKLREESTHAGHRCMSSGDQQSFIRGGSAQRSKPLFTILDRKGTPLVLPRIADKWYPFHIRSQERIADLA